MLLQSIAPEAPLLVVGYPREPNIKPNTHRRCRRDETVLSRRVCVGGVYMIRDDCRRIRFEHTTQPSAASLQFCSQWVTTADGCVYTDDTTNCRQLVANSCTHRRRDATRQFRLVGVGGVYWAIGTNLITTRAARVVLFSAVSV